MVDPNTRQGKRTPVTLKIKFKSETLEQFIERYAVDVSQGGIFIRTKEPLAVGTQMRFEFQLRDASPLIAGEGTVVWTRENDPSRPAIAPGMGVRFDRLAEGSQTVLERILAEKAKQAPQRPSETTKPPMFTDTPTKVAPAPVQDALLSDDKNSNEPKARPSGNFGDQGTPLPKPVPFHSDAEDFDEQAFEEATKVRAVDDLVAQSALDDTKSSSSKPTKTTTNPPANKLATATPSEPLSPFSEPSPPTPARRISKEAPAAAEPESSGAPFDRDSAPNLPSPPVATAASGPSKAPRLLDSTPSPRTDTPAPTPPPADAVRTKLGVEPASAPTRSASVTRDPEPKRPVDRDDSGSYPIAPAKSSAAPMVILVLFILAAAAGGVWFFVLRDKAKTENQPTPGSGSQLATGSGSAGSAITDVGSGSAGSGSAITDVGSAGSGSQMAGGSNAVVEPPKGPTVDTVITASVDKATIEIVGTDQTGPTPFTAKLEKDKAYQVKASAPGFASSTTEIKGGAPKPSVKLDPKPKKIEVTSTPDGALIYVDNKPTGHSTPFTVDIDKAKLTAKSYRISIRKGGFKPVDKVVDLKAFTEADDAMSAKVEATLEKAAAVVRPPQTGSGSAGSAAGSGTPPEGGNGSGTTPPAGGNGSGTTPPPPPPPDEPSPNL